jgi:hypothetical protein
MARVLYAPTLSLRTSFLCMRGSLCTPLLCSASTAALLLTLPGPSNGQLSLWRALVSTAIQCDYSSHPVIGPGLLLLPCTIRGLMRARRGFNVKGSLGLDSRGDNRCQHCSAWSRGPPARKATSRFPHPPDTGARLSSDRDHVPVAIPAGARHHTTRPPEAEPAAEPARTF